jgi:hypothetical protein
MGYDIQSTLVTRASVNVTSAEKARERPMIAPPEAWYASTAQLPRLSC